MTPELSPQPISAPARIAAGVWLRVTARWSAGAAIVVAPLRYRWLLQARPRPPVYGDYTDFLFFLSDALIVLTLGLWVMSVLIEPRPINTGPALLRWPLAVLIVIAAAALYIPVFGIYRLFAGRDPRARDGGFHAHPGP